MNAIIKDAIPNVFKYTDFRAFMRDHIEYHKQHRGISYRNFSVKAGFASASYLQQIISKKRKVSRASAQSIAQAFQLEPIASRYFMELVQSDVEGREVSEAAKRLRILSSHQVVDDDEFFGSWLIPVIWELASVQDARLTLDYIFQSLDGKATYESIQAALDFLLTKHFLSPTDKLHIYKQNLMIPDPSNDTECLRLQAQHKQFLELARRAMSHKQSVREFQNLTIAIPKAKIPIVKEKIRDLIKDLQLDLAIAPDAEIVYHIQLCAFPVTKKI
jgi:uncharacterized protein (TIGR02147 family)